jgi:hypothetical protein
MSSLVRSDAPTRLLRQRQAGRIYHIKAVQVPSFPFLCVWLLPNSMLNGQGVWCNLLLHAGSTAVPNAVAL